jgi:competence protein ComEA
VPVLPISRRQALLVTVALALLLFLFGKLLIGTGTSRSVPPHSFTPTTAAPAAAPKLVVDVVGAVDRPGLYRLRKGSRVADAVARAGGATAKANLDGLNLAAPLADGEQVVVPARSATPGANAAASSGSSAGGASPSTPVSLSTATLEQLDALPGVGPVTAQKILAYRAAHGAFRSIDELDAVSGIGPARLDELRGLVVP